MLERLPSVYRRIIDSNIGRLLTLPAEEIDELEYHLDRVESGGDIDAAVGETLDMHGRNLDEPRRGRSDEEYRLGLKTRIAANISHGDMETIIRIGDMLLGDRLLSVRPAWSDPYYEYEPAAVIVRYSPLGLEPYIAEYVRRVVLGGVRIFIENTFIVRPICGTFNSGHYDFTKSLDYLRREV